MSDTRSYPPEEILAWMRDSFDVYPELGVLVWRNPPKPHPRMRGLEAGSSRLGHSGKRYSYIKRNTRHFKRGWLVFLWVNGRWPAPMLDHIDGNSLNDAITNLREATPTQNAWNHKTRARRIKLPMGVRLMPGSGRYQARIACNKKKIHLGTYDTPEEAQRVYAAKRKELYREFA